MSTATLSPREQRGLAIAATMKLSHRGNCWIVPSQTGVDKYNVFPKRKVPHCTCPDHEATGQDCKHIYAVRFAMKRKQNADGSETVTESVTFTKKMTYSQNWPMYDLAQTTEKRRFQELLHDLCSRIPQPEKKPGRGRPKTPLADAVFAACFKVYSTVSTRRFMCDLADARDQGYIGKDVHFTSVAGFLENPELTPILYSLIVRAALPLTALETNPTCALG